MAYNIVKLENGNVALYDSGSGDFLKSISPDYVEIECNVNGVVKLIQDNGNVEYFLPADVANTQVLPAAAVPFAGTCADLAELLATDFFFEVTGGGIAFEYWKEGTVIFQNFLEVQGRVQATAASSVWAANNLAAYPVLIKEDVTIEDIRIAFSTSVAGNSVFGMYGVTDGLPDNLLFQSTPFDNSLSGVLQIDTLATPYSIKKGLYYIAFSTSSTPNIFARDSYSVINALGADNTVAVAIIAKTGGYPYTGTLPVTFGTAVTKSNGLFIPNVLFKIS